MGSHKSFKFYNVSLIMDRDIDKDFYTRMVINNPLILKKIAIFKNRRKPE